MRKKNRDISTAPLDWEWYFPVFNNRLMLDDPWNYNFAPIVKGCTLIDTRLALEELKERRAKVLADAIAMQAFKLMPLDKELILK